VDLGKLHGVGVELERYIDGAGVGVGVRFRKLDGVGVELNEKKPELPISER